MKYASVCDGIGAAHVAWQPLGWTCEWTSEIDAFPSAVVEQRWGFPNRGDMTKFMEWNDGAIDLLVGGTPCQSFSVAGLRKGLHDPRGGLMLGFLEIAQRYRPRWVVWENVPGVLSSNGGRDFGAFLGALGELGYGWAYRVLDAQWFGVAQRRRRVFVVGCLGDERRAAAVLFESESVRRDNPPSRAKGQGTAAATPSGTGSGCDAGTCGTICADKHPGSYSGQDAYTGRLIAQPIAFGGQMSTPQVDVDLSQTLQRKNPQAVALAVGTDLYNGAIDGEVAHSVRVGNGNAMGGVPSAMVRPFTKSKRAQSTTDDESWVPGEVAPTFNCFDQGDTRATTVVASTIGQRMRGQDDACANNLQVVSPMAVRRLTPRECERLQGFPDDYTAITYRNKPAADGPRYKALGNSMAVPVMRWIGERIAASEFA